MNCFQLFIKFFNLFFLLVIFIHLNTQGELINISSLNQVRFKLEINWYSMKWTVWSRIKCTRSRMDSFCHLTLLNCLSSKPKCSPFSDSIDWIELTYFIYWRKCAFPIGCRSRESLIAILLIRTSCYLIDIFVFLIKF